MNKKVYGLLAFSLFCFLAVLLYRHISPKHISPNLSVRQHNSLRITSLDKKQTEKFFSFSYPGSWEKREFLTKVVVSPQDNPNISLALEKSVQNATSAASLAAESLEGQKPIFLKVLTIDNHLAIEEAKETASGKRIDVFVDGVTAVDMTGIYHVFIDTNNADYTDAENIFELVLKSLRFL